MQTRLEHYLEEVSRPLPVAEREEWRMEVEQHLESIITAYDELGHTREEATEMALAKFGEAGRLGRQMEFESAAAKPLPWQLKGVSLFFALQGLMCWSLSIPRFLRNGGQNEALLVWGAPALFIAAGLLCRQHFWRKFAISLLCVTLFFTTPMHFAEHFQNASPLLKCFRFLAYSVVPAWQLWVLTRPEIKALFERKKKPGRFWARR